MTQTDTRPEHSLHLGPIDETGDFCREDVHNWFGLTYSSYLVLPRSLLQVSANGVGLKALPVKLAPHAFPVGIVTLKNRTLTPVVELFLERLRAFVKSGAARF